MIYQRLGKTEFNISAITFGGASIAGEGKGYGFGAITETDAIDLLLKAYDKGINAFDTAPIYGFTLSEKRMGMAFKRIREKVYIISKGGVGWHSSGRVNMNNDPALIQQMLDQSLRDLKSDYIDLYMIHWPDKKWDIRYPLEVLQKNKEQGKILKIGLCNSHMDDLVKSQDVCEVSVLQSEYNLFTDANASLFIEAKKLDLGIMAWGTLDKGILSGRVTKGRKYDDFDARKSAPWWNENFAQEKALKVAKLKLSAGELLANAIGYNLNSSVIDTTLVGMRDSQQLDDVLKALTVLPTSEMLVEIKERLK